MNMKPTKKIVPKKPNPECKCTIYKKKACGICTDNCNSKYLPLTPGYITSMFTYVNFCLLMMLCLLYLKAYSTDAEYTMYGSFFYKFSIMFKMAYWIMIAYVAQITIQLLWNLGVWLYGKRNNCKDKA